MRGGGDVGARAMADHFPEGTDPRTGYRSSDGIYYSKRRPVWIPQTPNLDFLTFLFAPQFGDRTALVDAPSGKSWTYRELESRVRVVAAGLYKQLGVRQYDVVMLLSSNCIEFPVIFLAVASLGAVLTTVNQVNTPVEIQKQMKDAGRAPHYYYSQLASIQPPYLCAFCNHSMCRGVNVVAHCDFNKPERCQGRGYYLRRCKHFEQ